MNSERSKGVVVLAYSALPSYRHQFLCQLQLLLGADLHVMAGDRHFRNSFRTTSENGRLLWRKLINVFLFRDRLLVQVGGNGAAIRSACAVLEYNPRIINVWMVLIVRRVLRRRTLLWGHAWSRSGASSRSEPVRRLQRRLATGVIMYTQAQARELECAGYKRQIWVAPNAMFYRRELGPVSGSRTNVLFVGRLDPDKKPLLLLNAFISAVALLPAEMRLCYVGAGRQDGILKARARTGQVQDRVDFLGHVSDAASLRRLYGGTLVAVAPGFAGLSATQALGFGVPLIYGDKEPHAPEAALLDDSNSRSFQANNPEDLARCLLEVVEHRTRWIAATQQIADITASEYSVEAMASAFRSAICNRAQTAEVEPEV